MVLSVYYYCSVETDVAPPCEFLGHDVFCSVHKFLRLKAEYKFFTKNDRYIIYLLMSVFSYTR